MKERFGDKIALRILKTDAPEALPFKFRSATNVVVDGEVVPIATGTDEAALAALLQEKL